jgi:A/G-specific adenine glycosylase
MSDEYVDELRVWFKEVKRDFPWRREKNAYKVLVSEIMLQQTRAITVLPYFNAWIKRFPDFETLANASEEEVIKLWEGLGYYSRARSLLEISRRVVQKFDGIFPSDLESILSFKGIGPYTAAAISHFAFGKRVIGADGNIKKVLARFYGHLETIEKEGPLQVLLDTFLPKTDSADIFEGLIELGATICAKKPDCERCPLSGGCKAYLEGLTERLPIRKQREKTIQIERVVFILETPTHILIKKGAEGVMKGLYEFPYWDKKNGIVSDLIASVEKQYCVTIEELRTLPSVVHHFTKYKSTLFPYQCKITSVGVLPKDYFFVEKSLVKNYPFSAGHRKILVSL